MKTLIVGAGEIGKSLASVLKKEYNVQVIDKDQEAKGKFEIMHICFPYSDKFKQQVVEYYNKYLPLNVVIHSTVPVGTTKAFDRFNFFHSPVRGKHPDLAESLTAFVKYIGTNHMAYGVTIRDYFKKAGLNCLVIMNSDNTEMAKILSTTKYGHDIIFMKEVKRLCNKHDLDFNTVYTHFTETYNSGYDFMSQAEFSKFHRPVLEHEHGPIGGHCVVQNCDLLDDELTDYVKRKNHEYSIR